MDGIHANVGRASGNPHRKLCRLRHIYPSESTALLILSRLRVGPLAIRFTFPNETCALKKCLIYTLKLLLILVMVYVTFGLIHALVKLGLDMGYEYSMHITGIGFCAGLVFFSLVSPFMRFYVLGHELTHWFTAKLFRRRTGGLKIGADHGNVRVDRPNLWIILSPYLIPFYTVVWLIIMSIIHIWVDNVDFFITFYAGLGLSYAYHIVMTLLALSKSQSDLLFHGRVFSVCLIVMVNFMILFAGVSYFSNNLQNGFVLLKKSYHLQSKLIRKLSGQLERSIR